MVVSLELPSRTLRFLSQYEHAQYCLFSIPLQKAETNGSKSTHETATSNGIYGEQSDDKDDTFSATKTRFTSTTPSQTAARGLDASLKEIDSKDRSQKEDSKEGEDKVIRDGLV